MLALDGNGQVLIDVYRTEEKQAISDPKHPSSQIREDGIGGIRYLFMGTLH